MRWLCGCLGQTGTESSVPKLPEGQAVCGSAALHAAQVVVSRLSSERSDTQDKDQRNAAPGSPRTAHRLAKAWSPGHVHVRIDMGRLLDRANKLVNQATAGQLKPDPHVAHLNQLLLKCTSSQRPGPELYERAAQILQDLRSWLQAAATQPGAGLVLLSGASEALSHSESLALSAGQVRFWSAPVVRQLTALLQLYAVLVDRCMAAPPPPPGPADPWQPLLASTLVQVLVRADLLQLMVEVLELVALNPEFEARAQREEAAGAAVCVLGFMRGLVCFAGTQLDAVNEKRLAQCLQVLADLLSPPRGLLPRLLQRPPRADDMPVHLHALHLLQQLFDSPPAVLRQLLRPVAADADADAVAAFYVELHLGAASRCYFESGGDPGSGPAELCMVHVLLLRSLARGGALPGARLRLNELLLSELAAEYGAGQVAAAASAAAAAAAAPARDSDGDDSSDGALGSDTPSPEPVAAAGAGTAPLGEGKFEFTYDLNEDLARILELEEKLGEAVEVSGFEYDQEGRQLLQRSSVMAAEAAVAAAAAAAGDMGLGARRPAAVSEGGRPSVPKLSFSGFARSALSSGRSGSGAGAPLPSAAPSARSRTQPTPRAAPPAPASFRGPASDRQGALPPTPHSAGAQTRRSSSPTRAFPLEASALRTPGPAIPMLDLSGLGSGSRSLANTRRSSAMNTAHGSSSGGGAMPCSGGGGGRRHVPDNAAIAEGGKVDSELSSCEAAAATTTTDPAAAAAVEPGCSGRLAAAGGDGGGDPLRRLLFRAPQLHALLLGSALEASITPQGGLDPSLWPQFPLEAGLRHNPEYLLTWHLNAGAGAAAVAGLERELGAGVGGGRAAAARRRLLRLLAKRLFDAGRYSELQFLARGAFSTVFRAKARALPGGQQQQQQQQVIIKSVPLPASCYDRCVLPDVYGEVAIMEQYKGCPGICQLLDYGLTDEAFWIVMRRYRCSLAEWRQRQSLGPANAAAATLYLSILLQVVAALKLLARDSVVHFDLKCSNVLIDPRPGTKDSELWSPLGPAPAGPVAAAPLPSPPFDAVLADFGEARSYRSAGEAFTVRIRGTEVYKSPEMLLMNQQPAPQGLPPPAGGGGGGGAGAARAALQGAGLASDVWSLGCLAFELLSGKVLFGGDYASVTHRVAFGGRGNLALDAAERAALGGRPALVALVEWVLARDPAQRPSLEQIEARVREVQAEVWSSNGTASS